MSDETILSMLPLAQQGYCCSQIILLLGLQAQGLENPALIRAASGLCHGIGGTGHTCGVLTGASCLLGLHAGKGRDHEEQDERLFLMLETLGQWFAEQVGGRFGGVTCADILGGRSTQPNPDICARLVADTLDQCLALLVDHGFDPAESRDA